MNNNIPELTRTDLERYAELGVHLKYENRAMVIETLKSLTLFGRDIREVERNINGILVRNPLLRKSYADILEQTARIFEAARTVPHSLCSQILGVSTGYIEETDRLSKERNGLIRELGIEAAHLGDFERRLVDYLSSKAAAHYKEGSLSMGKEFSLDPEYEEYIARSEVCQRLYSVLVEEMPFFEELRLALNKKRKMGQE